MPESAPIAAMPAGFGFAEAPVCEGAYYANASVSKFAGPGSKTLIYGASGAIGTAAVQLAKYYGADVTAVVAGRHLELASSLGADRVVDYATSEFRRLGRDFDFLLDAVGKMTVGQWRRLLKSDGHLRSRISARGTGHALPLVVGGHAQRQSECPPAAAGSAPAVNFLKERMEAGRFRAAVDRKYPLEAIADAYRYVPHRTKGRHRRDRRLKADAYRRWVESRHLLAQTGS